MVLILFQFLGNVLVGIREKGECKMINGKNKKILKSISENWIQADITTARGIKVKAIFIPETDDIAEAELALRDVLVNPVKIEFTGDKTILKMTGRTEGRQ